MLHYLAPPISLSALMTGQISPPFPAFSFAARATYQGGSVGLFLSFPYLSRIVVPLGIAHHLLPFLAWLI